MDSPKIKKLREKHTEKNMAVTQSYVDERKFYDN